MNEEFKIKLKELREENRKENFENLKKEILLNKLLIELSEIEKVEIELTTEIENNKIKKEEEIKKIIKNKNNQIKDLKKLLMNEIRSYNKENTNLELEIKQIQEELKRIKKIDEKNKISILKK